MRKIFYLLALLPILILLSCSEKNQEQNVIVNKGPEDEKGHCTISKFKLERKKTFPFNVCDRIELVTYDSLFTNFPIEQRIWKKTILSNSLGRYGFCERVSLNEKQTDSLFAIIYNYESIDDVHLSSACYNPRHAILFYKGNTLVQYFEICFECMGTQYLRNKSRFPKFCNDQWCYLQQFFRDSEIKKRLGKSKCY
jgi:hypothetical protein